MQSNFFILQDTNNAFLMKGAGETGMKGHRSGSSDGPDFAKQENVEFLSTLIGIVYDPDVLQTEGGSIRPDLVLGRSISENSQLLNEGDLLEVRTSGLKVDVSPMASEQAEKENGNSNKGISVLPLAEGQEEDGQKMKYTMHVADQIVQKTDGDDGAKGSSVITPAEKEGLSSKSTIQTVNPTTQKADGSSGSITDSIGAKPDSGPDSAHTASDPVENGIENGIKNSNKTVKRNTYFGRLENTATFETKTVVKSSSPEIENASINRFDKAAEKELLSKMQIHSKHLSEETEIRGIQTGQNRATGEMNLATPQLNGNAKSQKSDKATKHLSKELPFEEISVKSKPGVKDMGDISRRAGFLQKDPVNAKADATGAQTRESNLLLLNSQPQEKSPEIVSPSKDPDPFSKPLQSEIIKQVVDKTAMHLNTGRTVIRIALEPESLGHLRLQITTENQQVMLKVMTEGPLVKEILESNVNQLRTALHVHGLQIDDFDVFVAHDSDQQRGGYENAKFSSMGDGPIKEDMDDILPEDEPVTQLTEMISGDNLIDFFV